MSLAFTIFEKLLLQNDRYDTKGPQVDNNTPTRHLVFLKASLKSVDTKGWMKP